NRYQPHESRVPRTRSFETYWPLRMTTNSDAEMRIEWSGRLSKRKKGPGGDSRGWSSGRPPGGNTMGSGSIHVIGLHLGGGFQQRFQHVRDLVEVLAMVALSLFPGVPETDGNRPLLVAVVLQPDQFYKPGLPLEDGEHIRANFVAEFLSFVRFHLAFHNACEHSDSFRNCWKVKDSARCSSGRGTASTAGRRLVGFSILLPNEGQNYKTFTLNGFAQMSDFLLHCQPSFFRIQ